MRDLGLVGNGATEFGAGSERDRVCSVCGCDKYFDKRLEQVKRFTFSKIFIGDDLA